jgi:recombination protein RecR
MANGVKTLTYMSISDPISRVVKQLSKIPSIGEKTAERMALHMVKMSPEDITILCQVIGDLKNTRYCEICFNPIVDGGAATIVGSKLPDPALAGPGSKLPDYQRACRICSDTARDHTVVCIVEQSADLRALEQTGVYHGMYHVLGGHLAPLEGVDPQQLTIKQLMARLQAGQIQEVILATNPTLEGDATALYLQKLLTEYPVKVSRIAKGISSGSTIDSSNKVILTDALKNRQMVTGSKQSVTV